MKDVKPSLQTSWSAAVRLTARWLDLHERIDVLMESMPPGMDGTERGRCQHLVFGVVRHFSRIEALLGGLVAHPPRFVTRAILYVAAFELIEAPGEGADEGQTAKIVHHAVERTKELASPAEARLVNAVVRKDGHGHRRPARTRAYSHGRRPGGLFLPSRVACAALAGGFRGRFDSKPA